MPRGNSCPEKYPGTWFCPAVKFRCDSSLNVDPKIECFCQSDHWWFEHRQLSPNRCSLSRRILLKYLYDQINGPIRMKSYILIFHFQTYRRAFSGPRSAVCGRNFQLQRKKCLEKIEQPVLYHCDRSMCATKFKISITWFTHDLVFLYQESLVFNIPDTSCIIIGGSEH